MARTKTAKPARAKRTTRTAKPRKATRTTKARRAKPARARTTARRSPARAKTTKRRVTRATTRRAASTPKARVGATPSGKSDKDHLTTIIQSSTGCTAKLAKSALDNVISTITETLKKKGKVQLTGFGSFAVTRRGARMGRNPRTGAPVKIKASRSVRFRAGKTLKDAV